MNFFDQFGKDINNIQQEFLGPNYNYAKNILSPIEMNMLQFNGDNFNMISNNGLSELATDFAGLISYVELLVSGTTNASKTGKPLGNRYFLPTAGKCKGDNNSDQTRNVYVNNIPTGSIPIISSIDFTEFRGLVPGIFTDLEVLNPLALFSGMMTSSDASCSEVELSVVDKNNAESFQKRYVLNQDIQNITPCVFKNKINTLTKETCLESEAFSNINNNINNNNNFFNDDNLIKIYFIVLTLLYFYIFIKLFLKK
jgi:hypothetical protein